MIKRVGISFAFMLHSSGMFVYFWRMSHDPLQKYWKDYSWTVFYDLCIMVPYGFICLICALYSEVERGRFDKYFLLVNSAFTLTLSLFVIMQKFNILEHTYGLQISSGGIGIALLMITVCLYRHGYFSNN